jgi:hypothetical protein
MPRSTCWSCGGLRRRFVKKAPCAKPLLCVCVETSLYFRLRLSKRQGDVVDSLWVGGAIHSAASPDGPFHRVGAYPGGNPGPRPPSMAALCT